MTCTHRRCEAGKWAQCATCPEMKGRLRDRLGVPKGIKITRYPYRKNLIRIKRAAIGTKLRIGNKTITVTRLLKNRVIFALNMNPV